MLSYIKKLGKKIDEFFSSSMFVRCNDTFLYSYQVTLGSTLSINHLIEILSKFQVQHVWFLVEQIDEHFVNVAMVFTAAYKEKQSAKDVTGAIAELADESFNKGLKLTCVAPVTDENDAEVVSKYAHYQILRSKILVEFRRVLDRYRIPYNIVIPSLKKIKMVFYHIQAWSMTDEVRKDPRLRIGRGPDIKRTEVSASEALKWEKDLMSREEIYKVAIQVEIIR